MDAQHYAAADIDQYITALQSRWEELHQASQRKAQLLREATAVADFRSESEELQQWLDKTAAYAATSDDPQSLQVGCMMVMVVLKRVQSALSRSSPPPSLPTRLLTSFP